MEEQPVSVAPDVESPTIDDIIIASANTADDNQAGQEVVDDSVAQIEQTIDDMSLDDVKGEKSREDIIAEAEAQAYHES